MINNPPGNAEMQIQSLSWEELLGEEMAITPGFLLENSMDSGLGILQVSWDHKDSDVTKQLSRNTQ